LERFIASDGCAIAYRAEGDAGARPLLMLHGLMADSDFFDAQRPLAARHRLIRVDLRGHGRSAAGDRLDVARAADDIAELAAALDLQGAVGIGWSLGATALWRTLAGPAGARFAGAVVIDMTARVRNGDGWSLGLSPEACAARTEAMSQDFPAFAAAAGQAIFAQPIAPAHQAAADQASAAFARSDPAAIAALWGSLEQEDIRPLLGRIAQPTLIIHGAHSQLYGEETATHLAAALPNARAVRFDASGHAPHIEEPERFNRIIADFAASLPPMPASDIVSGNRRIG
jgi:pimeloyl-ACP methyl ester carboxylesterase